MAESNPGGRNMDELDQQDELLNDFRNRLPGDLKEYLTKEDSLRFLRARKKNAEKAAEMASDWWVWFNKPIPIPVKGEVAPRKILSPVEDLNEEIYQRMMPHSNYGIGKEGHPVYWEQTGLISTRFGEINKILSVDDMVTRHIRQQEIAVQRMNHYSSSMSKPISSQIIVMNLMNLSYKLDTKALSTFKQTLVIDQNYYPERLHILFMINAPWFFTAMWGMIKPWIDPVTVEKFQILGSNYLPTLREYIDDEYIPSEYGGGCQDFPWQWPLNNEDFLASISYTAGGNASTGSASGSDGSSVGSSGESVTDIAPTPPLSPSLRTPLPTLSSVNLPLLYFRMHKVEDLGSYHGYRMMVRYTDLQSWQVSRRYSEFRKFRDSLKRISAIDGHVQWPKLPPKALFRKSKVILSQRFLGLELFMSAVITKIARAYADACEEGMRARRSPSSADTIPAVFSTKTPMRKETTGKLKVLLLEFLDAQSNLSALLSARDTVAPEAGGGLNGSSVLQRPALAAPLPTPSGAAALQDAPESAVLAGNDKENSRMFVYLKITIMLLAAFLLVEFFTNMQTFSMYRIVEEKDMMS